MFWRLLPLEENNPYYNMAVDEAILLSHSQRKIQPTLRFYTWYPPSISLGYFQKILPREKEEWIRLNIPFVRRMTGGKAVFHNHDLTYSFIIAEDINSLPKNIVQSCNKIGLCLYEGLRNFGLSENSLDINSQKVKSSALGRRSQKPEAKRQKTDNCFNIFSQGEILYDDKKLIGSAQVRKKGVVLQHGSILVNHLPVWGVPCDTSQRDNDSSNPRKMITLKKILGREVEFNEIIPFIVSGFEKIFNTKFSPGQLTDEEKKSAKELESKYRDANY